MKALTSKTHSIKRSRGAILVLAAFVLVMFMGLVALAVDLGVIAMAYGQLRTVADDAALAGARQLVSDNRLNSTYTPTLEVTNATNQAIAIGQANIVLNQAAVVQSSDVAVGYKQTSPLDPTDSTFVRVTDSTTNSVRLRPRATAATWAWSPPSSAASGAPRARRPASRARQRSSSTRSAGSPTGRPQQRNTNLLPIALSQPAYNSIFSNQTDNYSSPHRQRHRDQRLGQCLRDFDIP